MLYGSSTYPNTNVVGLTGSRGITGNTGSIGPVGNRGPTGATGNTGPNLVGMTLASNFKINNSYSDGTVTQGDELTGPDGDYFIGIDGTNLAIGSMGVFSGISYFTENIGGAQFTRPELRIRGLTTASQNEDRQIIKIVGDTDLNDIEIVYNLTGLPYLGISAGSVGQLAVHVSGSTFAGLTGTKYDTSLQTVNLQSVNYAERIHFVESQKNTISGTSNVFYLWTINWEESNTFVLNDYVTTPGETTVAQVVLLKNPPDKNFAKSLTIVIPSGITSSVLTKFATANDVSSFSLNNAEYSVSWPLTYPPCLSEGIDAINFVYIDGIWYANYGIYNSASQQVDWNASYNNCAGSIDIPDPDVFGLCCVSDKSCNLTSFVGLRSSCAAIPNATFFPGKDINYPGCSAGGSLGICCYRNNDGKIQKHPSPIKVCDCQNLASETRVNPQHFWQEINDCNKNVNAIDCALAFEGKGTCCYGNGDSSIETENDCLANGHYWHGPGTVSEYLSLPNFTNFRCRTGTGGCCTTGICSNTSFTNCVPGGLFFGCGYTCSNSNCASGGGDKGGGGGGDKGGGGNGGGSTPRANCQDCFNQSDVFVVKKYNTSGIQVGVHELRLGDSFAGGIVAGVFNPKGTTCIGNEAAFSGFYRENNVLSQPGIPINTIPAEDLLYGDLAEKVFNRATNGSRLNFTGDDWGTLGAPYNTIYDPQGYGFTLASEHNGDCDSWLMIVMPFPAVIHQDEYENLDFPNNLIKYETRTYTGQLLVDNSQEAYTSLEPVFVEDLFQSRRTRTVNRFVWSHGGTAYAPTLPSNLISFSTTANENTTCVTQLAPTTTQNDGQYGTLPTTVNGVAGSTYWGNIYTYDTCVDIPHICGNNCADSPLTRISAGQTYTFTRNTGYWSRNYGILNTIRLFNSDIAEYYLKSGNGLGGSQFSNLEAKYGATGSSDFVVAFNHTGTAKAKTTIAEATSVYNRKYFTSEDMISEGFPQVSRWYVPSIEELSFLRYQCETNKLNLQQKIITYPDTNGIAIGDRNIGANGWVWSSTGSFDTGITAEYIQAVGGVPSRNTNTKQFSSAFAMKFPVFQNSQNVDSILSTGYYQNTWTKKANDFNDRYELRLVRFIRCDQRYYSNSTNEQLVNSVWNVPRLTESAICNGSTQPDNNGNTTTYNSSNFNSDIQTFTIYRNQT